TSLILQSHKDRARRHDAFAWAADCGSAALDGQGQHQRIETKGQPQKKAPETSEGGEIWCHFTLVGRPSCRECAYFSEVLMLPKLVLSLEPTPCTAVMI